MSLCVVLNADGTLTPTGQPVADCTGYVLATPTEIWLSQTLAQALNPPDVEVMAGWWLGCFSLVIVCYVASRGIGALLHIVK